VAAIGLGIGTEETVNGNCGCPWIAANCELTTRRQPSKRAMVVGVAKLGSLKLAPTLPLV
jgi:hypothetical protein